MADTGWASPGTVSIISDLALEWSNINNVKVSDNAYATVGGSPFDRIKASNFGFNIPSGATIDGIVVDVEAKLDSGTRDHPVYIADYASTFTFLGNKEITYSDTEQVITLGGPTDTWNGEATVSKINSSDFSVVIGSDFVDDSISYSIDHIRIKVYYTEAGNTSLMFQMF